MAKLTSQCPLVALTDADSLADEPRDEDQLTLPFDLAVRAHPANLLMGAAGSSEPLAELSRGSTIELSRRPLSERPWGRSVVLKASNRRCCWVAVSAGGSQVSALGYVQVMPAVLLRLARIIRSSRSLS